jgi:hypothetical protein
MRFFGICVYIFGFLMSGLFVVWGFFRIASPAKALAVDQFFMGKKRFSRVSGRFAQTSKMSWMIVGALTMGFGFLFGWSLIRSLVSVH